MIGRKRSIKILNNLLSLFSSCSWFYNYHSYLTNQFPDMKEDTTTFFTLIYQYFVERPLLDKFIF